MFRSVSESKWTMNDEGIVIVLPVSVLTYESVPRIIRCTSVTLPSWSKNSVVSTSMKNWSTTLNSGHSAITNLPSIRVVKRSGGTAPAAGAKVMRMPTTSKSAANPRVDLHLPPSVKAYRLNSPAPSVKRLDGRGRRIPPLPNGLDRPLGREDAPVEGACQGFGSIKRRRGQPCRALDGEQTSPTSWLFRAFGEAGLRVTNGIYQIPPDYVVKCQGIDIVYVISE